jgi:hypothetical protein
MENTYYDPVQDINHLLIAFMYLLRTLVPWLVYYPVQCEDRG